MDLVGLDSKIFEGFYSIELGWSKLGWLHLLEDASYDQEIMHINCQVTWKLNIFWSWVLSTIALVMHIVMYYEGLILMLSIMPKQPILSTVFAL